MSLGSRGDLGGDAEDPPGRGSGRQIQGVENRVDFGTAFPAVTRRAGHGRIRITRAHWRARSICPRIRMFCQAQNETFSSFFDFFDFPNRR